MIEQRIIKNHKRLKGWIKSQNIEAYRLYDRDIPEYPFIIDIYKNECVIYEKSDFQIDTAEKIESQYLEIVKALQGLLDPKCLHYKKREKKNREDRYEKINQQGNFLTVHEGPARFLVNLTDYLDTGLFLDHRPLRSKIFKMVRTLKESSPIAIRLLNLFSYTGSVSVYGALGGALVTSIDMSKTYIDWSKKNFLTNDLDLNDHEFINEDAMWYLHQPTKKLFDVIVLDPPTFSNSKKMDKSFDVERDQTELLENTLKHLTPSGVLFFSTNKRSFRLDKRISEKYAVKDISLETIPIDFHDQKIHQCYHIKKTQ